MLVGIPREIYPGENRVAVIPSGIQILTGAGFDVVVQSGAGEASHYDDDEFRNAGASIAPDAQSLYSQADLVLKVRHLVEDEVNLVKEGATLICMLDAWFNQDLVKQLAARKIRSFALEFIPRITRAQSMDVLSSMAAISGYRAVLAGAMVLPQYFPMLMTAAGTIHPAKVFIIGAGVAGLMAISTARRLGAVVEAYDTRVEVKEQVESLGAKFVEFDLPQEEGTSAGGYAKQQSEEFYKAQREQMSAKVAQSDLVITTAAIPGKPSPRLVTADMLKCMKKGSVIVDLAAERGGNVEGTEKNKKVYVDGVTIIGYIDHPSRVPVHASQLFTKNIITFLQNMTKDGEIELNMEDEIVAATLVTDGGEIKHAGLLEAIEKGAS
ncbi:MAG: NAD(P)(+) transhydrogenase (Re/Si-specific) subunit alpha [Pseudomonadales bacterium]|jgi:H+-translocating NAD(P) transhydrogenase subunit alpha|nr:NAD(P)(+) transhydrogenase (Re/Si-specific) subunit alpha [Pseudomonadales bacterium]TNC89509.1 MAG: NAD(P)(+) transhydrogenase (Re/Si-specific) subunit alpha [Alcanivorax sp.]HAU12155.1 Re/Si-specific NAD(P)(+) transhydrogenase subunit alpha [Gammaproteobacteria bacterium]MAQ25271.1 NAD(P)(+) transhydrogenase (Re/Si-specific) subunit alpha [Pseudomonadales bacterium]MBI26011.1 NAD(P)(+) transhydrogenase (Re/Si-specific) subunit alpha [Pseudomonadales bacterium]|tara:strand:+ start:12181 stop:13323 length:1143 start_codon:yes stop_codon:yes gene_type:complete